MPIERWRVVSSVQSMRTATSVSAAARCIRRAVRCYPEMNNRDAQMNKQAKSRIKRPRALIEFVHPTT